MEDKSNNELRVTNLGEKKFWPYPVAAFGEVWWRRRQIPRFAHVDQNAETPRRVADVLVVKQPVT